MSELALQQGLQTAIQAMTEFADAEVVINDYTVYDRPTLDANYVLIENSDDFDSAQDVTTPETTWNIPCRLIVPYIDWKTTEDSFRDHRQAIIDQINSAQRPDGSGINVVRVRNQGNIIPFYDRAITIEMIHEADPIFLEQTLIVIIEEF